MDHAADAHPFDELIDGRLDAAHDSGGDRDEVLRPVARTIGDLDPDDRGELILRCLRRARERIADLGNSPPEADWDFFAYTTLVQECLRRPITRQEGLLASITFAVGEIKQHFPPARTSLPEHVGAVLPSLPADSSVSRALSETGLSVVAPMSLPPQEDATLAATLQRLADESMTDRFSQHSATLRLPAAQSLRETPTDQHPEIIRMAIFRVGHAGSAQGRVGPDSTIPLAHPQEQSAMTLLIAELLPTATKDRPDVLEYVCQWSAAPAEGLWCLDHVDTALQKALTLHAEKHALTPPMVQWLNVLRDRVLASYKPDQKRILKIKDLLGEPDTMNLDLGEAWSDQAIADIAALESTSDRAVAWRELITLARTTAASKPSAAWLKSAEKLIARIGRDAISQRLVHWLPLVDRPRTSEKVRHHAYEGDFTHRIIDPHVNVLKCLCWIAATIPDRDLARALARLAISCYRKLPGIGPRAVKLGNAAVYALGQMPGRDAIGQLAMLRVKVKFGTAQQGIEKALTAAAQREGLPRQEIEEIGVPTYGLTQVGKRSEPIGDFTAELTVTGIGDTELRFIPTTGPKAGKAQASVPAAIKQANADDLKELKAAAKDIGAMLPAQRDRIDAMFLDNKSWAFAVWRERYLDHPLVGVVARRLIWRITDGKGDTTRAATWLDEAGSLVDVTGEPAKIDPESAIVRLWHPIDVPTDEVLTWRRFFENRAIKQPFKQAHREVYLLTDAELRTGTYSNRFAAHVLRQHQFNALCAVRGWKNKLRLLVDDEYPPASRRLPAHNLRAEFWVEGAGDEFGRDTNESGVYQFLTTDQVRFYPIDAGQASAHAGGGGYRAGWNEQAATGLPLNTIPPLVLSEILRDVDLFVGVTSLGNNPQWNDGGPVAAHREYWQSFSFGELSETGKGRRDLLQRLIPRLSIAPVCSFDGHFLIVQGSIRTYKIHLGSGNIMMAPNDQYLCIVPTSRGESEGTKFLPFEGDRTLSIILSKAMMLAADQDIKDASIVSQIKR